MEAIAGVEILGRPEVNDTEKEQMLPKTMDTLTSCRSALMLKESLGEDAKKQNTEATFQPGAVMRH